MSSFYKKIVLKGNSEVISPDFKLRADEIEIYGENGSYLEARGNVFYEDFKNKMHVKAQFLFFNRKLDNFYLQKGVELEDLENNMLIKAERVEGSNKSNVYIMQYSVKIYKDDTFARAENGTYNKEEKEMILEGVPVIYQKDNYYSASRIIFNTKTNRYKLEGSVEGEFTQVENDVSEEKNKIEEIKENLNLNSVNNVVLRADNIIKKYGEKFAVNGITIDIHKGEVVGLLGPNGAGKTTTFYTIVGFIRPNSGKVLINNYNISSLNMYERARIGIVYLPQDASIFRELTVEENIMVALERREDLSKAERKIELVNLLKEFEIKRIQSQKAYTLSGGERRRAEIARALAVNPYFLLLDEPFAGIDPIAIGDIKNIIKILKERNIGVLITDHNVRDAFDIIDRAYIVYQGQVLDEGDVDYIISSEKAKKLYLGEEFKL